MEAERPNKNKLSAYRVAKLSEKCKQKLSKVKTARMDGIKHI